MDLLKLWLPFVLAIVITYIFFKLNYFYKVNSFLDKLFWLNRLKKRDNFFYKGAIIAKYFYVFGILWYLTGASIRVDFNLLSQVLLLVLTGPLMWRITIWSQLLIRGKVK